LQPTTRHNSRAALNPPKVKRTYAVEIAAGALLLAAGIYATFATLGLSTTSEYLACELIFFAFLLLGGILLADGLHRAGHPERLNASPFRTRGASVSLLGASFAVSLVWILVSTGMLPGLYIPSPFSSHFGCGTSAPQSLGASAPPGFPPAAQVKLTWSTENGGPVVFWIIESLPGSLQSNVIYDVNGSSGLAAFTANGGSIWWGASSPWECSSTEIIEVHGSYTFGF